MSPPQALQIGPVWENGSPKFLQQGQVDWVAFGNTVWSASAAVLQRFASSGIQPMTFGAGLALASEFRISDIGRQRMHRAMQSLRGVPGLNKILWFGFGHKSFVSMMGESQLGINTVALCSCLTEVHSEEVAARVLAELWRLNDFPEDYEPSHSQLLSLVKACSGVMTYSAFNSTLNTMIDHPRAFAYSVSPGGLKSSSASDIAKALRGLFQITRRKVERIRLVGENECAFIAAVGHLLFDLKVYIENDAGNLIYASRGITRSEDAQIAIRYTSKDEPTALQQATTYLLPVGTDIISPGFPGSSSQWILRYPWDGCLLRTFGPTFRNLCSLAHTLGSFLGSTARIYAALAEGEPVVAEFSRSRFIEFSQLGYGQGFIHSVTSTFEELNRLNPLQGAMERALDSTFDSAYREVEQAVQGLRGSCHCDVCSGRYLDEQQTADPPWCDCLPSLALTIRKLVTILSSVDRDNNLLVAASGLRSEYGIIHSSYRDWIKDEKKHKCTLVGVAVGLVSMEEETKLGITQSETLLQDIRPLFDGSVNLSRYLKSGGVVAEASSGICCYRQCLHGISSEAGAMRIIHVLPGHIERGTAQYDVVEDGDFGQRVPPKGEPAKLDKADSAVPKHEPIKLGSFEINALATESSTYRCLELCYKITLPNGYIAYITPGLFSNNVLELGAP